MSAAELKEILNKEYGIRNEEEFNEAVRKSVGINIGIFTTPLERSGVSDQETETKIIA